MIKRIGELVKELVKVSEEDDRIGIIFIKNRWNDSKSGCLWSDNKSRWFVIGSTNIDNSELPPCLIWWIPPFLKDVY